MLWQRILWLWEHMRMPCRLTVSQQQATHSREMCWKTTFSVLFESALDKLDVESLMSCVSNWTSATHVSSVHNVTSTAFFRVAEAITDSELAEP